LVGDMKKLDMGLSVKIEVEYIKGIERDLLQKVVDKAHEVRWRLEKRLHCRELIVRLGAGVGLSLQSGYEG
jgi:hypothetical protein